MILDGALDTTTEQRLSFATLAFQAEYGDLNDNEELPDSFILEHYIPKDLINEV